MSTIGKWIILALIPVFVLSICFMGLSRVGALDSYSSRWMNYNDSINASNQFFAGKNEFGFTDKNRSRKRKNNDIRIAVLGDSFVYGDGLPFHQLWPHQLELMLDLEYPDQNIEVLTWGKCGWSTLDEYNFILNHGHEFEIDILLIGFVHNDPDLGNIPQITDEEVQFLSEVKNSIPLLGKLYGNYVLSKKYKNWIPKIYTTENLNDYSELLSKLDSVTANLNWATRFIFTPSVKPGQAEYFSPIKQLLDDKEIKYFDLEPVVSRRHGRWIDYINLQANPTNGHPGDVLNTLFVTNIYFYLRQNGLLQN